jgi:hypothetical protein
VAVRPSHIRRADLTAGTRPVPGQHKPRGIGELPQHEAGIQPGNAREPGHSPRLHLAAADDGHREAAKQDDDQPHQRNGIMPPAQPRLIISLHVYLYAPMHLDLYADSCCPGAQSRRAG